MTPKCSRSPSIPPFKLVSALFFLSSRVETSGSGRLPAARDRLHTAKALVSSSSGWVLRGGHWLFWGTRGGQRRPHCIVPEIPFHSPGACPGPSDVLFPRVCVAFSPRTRRFVKRPPRASSRHDIVTCYRAPAGPTFRPLYGPPPRTCRIQAPPLESGPPEQTDVRFLDF